LPETAEEAKEIAKLLNAPLESNPLQLRENASCDTVFRFNAEERLDDYQYVVFATHGVLPGEVDQITQPALVLSHPDKHGYLTMADVFQLQLNAKLVSLSACNTGSGEQVKGEGVMGLTRAFMYAGTPAIAVTLWSVETFSAKALDVGLFEYLKKGRNPVDALRAIKLQMLRGEKGENYRHPYYWAPFALFGDGR
jgi:CHAT domain-containing protein